MQAGRNGDCRSCASVAYGCTSITSCYGDLLFLVVATGIACGAGAGRAFHVVSVDAVGTVGSRPNRSGSCRGVLRHKWSAVVVRVVQLIQNDRVADD